ncbi:MAG: SUMF1/EgtB/PvdO family nonheme iron enzyme [Cyanobacteria bacterium J06621_8]
MSQNSNLNWQTLLKWFPTGVGSVVTGHFFIAGERFTQAMISFGVTVILALWASLSGGFVKGVKKKADEKGQAFGEALVEFVLEDLPRKLLWKLSRFERRYRKSLIDYYRDLKIEGFKIGLPVIDLEDVFIPLKLVTEIPDNIAKEIIADNPIKERKEQKIWSFLAQSSQIASYSNIAILAPPGYGKTTLLQYLTLIYAKKLHNKYQAPYFLPILLFLRDLRGDILQEHPPDLPELIRNTVKQQPAFAELKPPPQWFTRQLKQGKCLVMLDGLDEVANEQERIQVSKWINEQMLKYKSSTFLLTSRPYGYDSDLFEKVGIVLEVKSFNLDQIKKFIHKWYRQTEIRMRGGRKDPAVVAKARDNAQDLIERIVNSPPLRVLATNPLLVTMIATVHYTGAALPRRRVELYEKICDVLLGGRLSAKKLQTTLTVGQRKSVLQVLALKLMERETRSFKLAEAGELIYDQFATVDQNLTPELFLAEIKDVCGLLVEKQIGIYEFAHLSFQEYLAAAQIKKIQQENILIDTFNNPWWAETIRLYASQGDATKLIEQALNNSDVYSLTLAYDCLEEGLERDPNVRNRLEDILEKGLESSDPSIFKIAAEVKLSRRLRDILVIDEDRSIDQSFITCAEYQLFINERLNSGEPLQPGTARIPITGVRYQDAFKFCVWLNLKAYFLALDNSEDYYYRLPTATEMQNYPVKDGENLSFEFLNFEQLNTQDRSIRVVRTRTKIPWLFFEFNVVTVNFDGEEIRQERYCAQYITENLSNSIKLEMVYIPGGTFMMGSLVDEGNGRERPQHDVTVQPFLIGKYPVTQAQYQQVMGENPSRFKDDERPVKNVSWDDAVEFCLKLSQQTEKEYRLPSEAEWEYACRAGTTTPYHFGNTITDKLANYGGNMRGTTDVGQYQPNTFGLYDMHGNVWEWCEDDWHENYQGAPTDCSAWRSRNSNHQVIRGGSWFDFPSNCRSAIRNDLARDFRDDFIGFRVVCVAPGTV